MRLSPRDQRLVDSICSDESGCRPCDWIGRLLFWGMAIVLPIMVVVLIAQGVTGYNEYEMIARQHGGYSVMERLAAEDRGPTREEWDMLEAYRSFGFRFVEALVIVFFYVLGYIIWRQQRLIRALAGSACASGKSEPSASTEHSPT